MCSELRNPAGLLLSLTCVPGSQCVRKVSCARDPRRRLFAMETDRVFQRVTAAVAGALFLVLAGLLAVGFGGLGAYPWWVRYGLAGLVVLYGLMRLRRAFRHANDLR